MNQYATSENVSESIKKFSSQTPLREIALAPFSCTIFSLIRVRPTSYPEATDDIINGRLTHILSGSLTQHNPNFTTFWDICDK